jgi:hypothetical protein
MAQKIEAKAAIGSVFLALFVLLAAAACDFSATSSGPAAIDTLGEVAGLLGAWDELLREVPYPYGTPLPPTAPTLLDGTYAKVDPRPGERAGCRRCPPYPPEGGIWKLSLSEGAFHVMHERTEWRTLGSFAVSGERIAFFNDPHCHRDVGVYTWRLEAGQLVLGLIEDNCGVDLRARSLTAQPWLSCQPPSTEAAVTDHWPRPPGCD